MSPTHQDLSNDTIFSQIKSHVPVPLSIEPVDVVFGKAGSSRVPTFLHVLFMRCTLTGGGIHHCKKLRLLRVTLGYPEYSFMWNPPLIILPAFHLLS